MASFKHACNRGPHEDRLVEQKLDLERGRERGLDARENGLELGHDVERGGAAILEYREQRAATAVMAHDVLLHGVAVADVSDVADVDSGSVDLLNRKIVERRDALGKAVELDGEFVRSDAGVAGRQNQALLVDGVDHVARREALGV